MAEKDKSQNVRLSQPLLPGASIPQNQNKTKNKWIIRLEPYFTFLKSEFVSGRTIVYMKCNLCVEGSKNSEIKGKGEENFRMHLKSKHLASFTEYEKAVLKDKAAASLVSSVRQKSIPKPSTRKIKPVIEYYNKDNPCQIQFRERLLEFFVTDAVPFNLVNRTGFVNLIKSFDPKIKIPSRRTIGRNLETKFDAVSTFYFKFPCRDRELCYMKSELLKLPEKSLHLIIDLWSSRQNVSVLGITAQYIKEYRITQSVVGFQEFPDSHTAEHIRTRLDNLLFTELGLKANQIHAVTADNASNVVAAFKLKDLPLEYFSNMPEDNNDDTEESESGESEDGWENWVELLNIPEDISTIEDLVLLPDLVQNHCCAHLLQLAIADAIAACLWIIEFIKTINKLTRFFYTSNKWYSKLKKINGNLSLVKPCVTRWNSQFHSFKRLLRHPKKAEGSMIECINVVLKEAKADRSVRKDSLPKTLKQEDVEALTTLLQLLEPFAALTDTLQGDGVTSSLAIPGLINSIQMVENIEIGTNANLMDFKNSLLKSIKERFTTDKDSGETVLNEQGKPRRIVTINLPKNKSYILATLLDPRIKGTPFVEDNREGSSIKMKLPTLSEAVLELKNSCKDLNDHSLSGDTEKDVEVESSQSTSKYTPPSKKFKLSLFSQSKGCSSTQTLSREFIIAAEIEKYLNATLLEEDDSPLIYWKQNCEKFPHLTRLATTYLTFPATSGGVERLFSVAGAIGRARRAKITTTTMEMLLCYRQQILNSRIRIDEPESDEDDEENKDAVVEPVDEDDDALE